MPRPCAGAVTRAHVRRGGSETEIGEVSGADRPTGIVESNGGTERRATHRSDHRAINDCRVCRFVPFSPRNIRDVVRT